jgi:uncharacterized protein YndB with AHSA1/START domain
MSQASAERDLFISRIIKAPRAAVWRAWTDPASFEQWWIPQPLKCKVVQMDLRPGGAFITQMSENGADYTPHLNACFLAIDNLERIVFTNALLGGWRPAEEYYPTALTAIITLRDHPDGTDYAAHVMHRTDADRRIHEEMGFAEGWGTVLGQLARLLEPRA